VAHANAVVGTGTVVPISIKNGNFGNRRKQLLELSGLGYGMGHAHGQRTEPAVQLIGSLERWRWSRAFECEFGLTIAGIAQGFTFPIRPSKIIVFSSILYKLLRGEPRGEGVADNRLTDSCSHTGFAF
jgi:hypothetical protein